jgi:hypothetical protein
MAGIVLEEKIKCAEEAPITIETVSQTVGSGPPGSVAGLEIERRQLVSEIHVQPLAAFGCGVLDRLSHKLCPDALVLMRIGNFGIEQKRVTAAVPGDVDEADQSAIFFEARGHPAKTVWSDSIPPARFRVAAVTADERDHLVVGDGTTPCVDNVIFRII